LGIDPILPPAGYHFGEGKFMIVRPPATLGHAAYLATYLLYAIFAGAELEILESKRLRKAAALAASVLAFFAMILSGTRAALVGLAAGAVFMVLRDRLNRKVLYAAAALLVVVAALYASPLGERLRARVFWSSEDPLGGSRLTLWRDTASMSLHRPLIGFGPETFSIEYPRFQSIELARAYPDFYHESPHNIFLDALVSKGFLGLIAMIALCVYGLSISRGFMGAAFLAILVSQQFTTFTLPTELFFYLTLAMLASDFKAAAPPKFQPIRAVLAIPFVLLAIYLSTGDALLASARRALDRGDAEQAAAQLHRARAWNASADFYFSR